MTATTMYTPNVPLASAVHRTRIGFSEVREAHRARVLTATAILTGLAAVSVSAVAAIALSVAA